MRYIVEYVGSDLRVWAAQFNDRADAEYFADNLPAGSLFLDFYSEAIVNQAGGYTIRRRDTRYTKVNNQWVP